MVLVASPDLDLSVGLPRETLRDRRTYLCPVDTEQAKPGAVMPAACSCAHSSWAPTPQQLWRCWCPMLGAGAAPGGCISDLLYFAIWRDCGACWTNGGPEDWLWVWLANDSAGLFRGQLCEEGEVLFWRGSIQCANKLIMSNHYIII